MSKIFKKSIFKNYYLLIKDVFDGYNWEEAYHKLYNIYVNALNDLEMLKKANGTLKSEITRLKDIIHDLCLEPDYKEVFEAAKNWREHYTTKNGSPRKYEVALKKAVDKIK